MSYSYDPSRRRSVDDAGSSNHHGRGQSSHPDRSNLDHLTNVAVHIEPQLASSLQSRHMPPPSSPQLTSANGSTHLNTAPRGPPTSSPFTGLRDLASFSSYRQPIGMPISSMLGAERKIQDAPPVMPPPATSRARASSMREPFARGFRDVSPQRNIFSEPRPASVAVGLDRIGMERPRDTWSSSLQHPREPLVASHPYVPPYRDIRGDAHDRGSPQRPNSQPPQQRYEPETKSLDRREAQVGSDFGPLHHTEDLRMGRTPRDVLSQSTPLHSRDRNALVRPVRHEPWTEVPRERIEHNIGPERFQSATSAFSTREDQPIVLGPMQQGARDPTKYSSDARKVLEFREDAPHTPAAFSGVKPVDQARSSFTTRPITFQEDQRLESIHREEQLRKQGDGPTHRSLLNISPELNRRERNSPLPQAVQGAQSRLIGPGGDDPAIKTEFGRMFSGLGSGVGTATPTAMNGTATPSRLSPGGHVQGGDLVRTAVAEIEQDKSGSKIDDRRAKRQGRYGGDDALNNADGRDTPDTQHGPKRAKTNHAAHHHHHHLHPHHHHHHHHETADNSPSMFSTLRFQPNPMSTTPLAANPTHHHHHHPGAHAHPGHHHHHTPRTASVPRKPSVSVMSRKVIEDCSARPRHHLGSQLYTIEKSSDLPSRTSVETKLKRSGKMKPIPFFEDHENCTYTIRVPRSYLVRREVSEPSHLEQICKRRQIWGTDIYTDDSDIVAAAVHSGWLQGDFGENNTDLHDLCDNEPEHNNAQHDPDRAAAGVEEAPPTTLLTQPSRPLKPPSHLSAHITILILPALESYASTSQHHILSREWGKHNTPHDGMSFAIHRIDFVDEGSESDSWGRDGKARKARLKLEESRRRDAAASLLMFATSAGMNSGSVEVGA